MKYRRWLGLGLLLVLSLAAIPRSAVSPNPRVTLVSRLRAESQVEAARRHVHPDIAYAIVVAAHRYRLRRDVAFGLVRLESRYRVDARGAAGEIGLTQVLPSTAAAVCGVRDTALLRRPDVNLDCGYQYLRRMLRRYGGNYTLALTAYNGGPQSTAVLHRLADSLRYAAKVTPH